MGTEPSDSVRRNNRPMPVELASLSPDELNALDRALAAAPGSDERSLLIQQLRLESPRKAAQLVKLMEWREPPTGFLKEPLLAPGLFANHQRSLQTGQLVANRYRIERLLGSGGMGDVYCALDTATNTRVALKTLRSEIVNDKGMIERFRREFNLSRRIDHPNVCHALDLGISNPDDPNEVSYITMELLEGPSLSAHLRKSISLSPESAYPILRQLLMGVGAAHREGIVHRDLKPSNVHLCSGPNGELRVVVTDFGLARMAQPTESLASLTGTGNVIGTLAYMAPEVLSGKEASFPADIYAIGVMIYEMMTGQRPFGGDSPFVPALKCLSEDAPDPRLLVPNLDQHWVVAIKGCLERDPAKRFSIADMVLRVIEDDATATATLATFQPPSDPPQPPPPNRRKLLIGVAAAILVIAGFIVSPAGKSLRAPTAPEASVLTEYQQAQTLLSRFDKPGNTAQAAKLFEQAIAADPRNALAHAGLARAFLLQFTSSRDSKLLEKASAEGAKALELNPNLAAVHVIVGRIARSTGNTEIALQELMRALELDSRSADARAALGYVFEDQGRMKEAEESYRMAVDLEPNDWRFRNDLGLFYQHTGKNDLAAQQFQSNVTLTPDNAAAFNNLGSVYQALNRNAEAVNAFQESIRIDPKHRNSYSNLGLALFYQGKYEEAAKTFQIAVDLNPSRYSAWGNLAGAYQWSPNGKEKAIAAYKKATELAEQSRIKTPKDAALLSTLAGYRAFLGENEASLRLIRQAVALAPENPSILSNAAEAYELLGMRDEALIYIGKALDAGFQIQLLDQSPDLAKLRTDPRFQALASKRK